MLRSLGAKSLCNDGLVSAMLSACPEACLYGPCPCLLAAANASGLPLRRLHAAALPLSGQRAPAFPLYAFAARQRAATAQDQLQAQVRLLLCLLRRQIASVYLLAHKRVHCHDRCATEPTVSSCGYTIPVVARVPATQCGRPRGRAAAAALRAQSRGAGLQRHFQVGSLVYRW